MPRYFKPVGGFADKSVDVVKIDDNGFSHYVNVAGDESLAAHVDHNKTPHPTWTLDELVNMTKGGKWVEIKSPADVVADTSKPVAQPAPEPVKEPAQQQHAEHAE